jgi:prepilin-type N-terminal cleavage/methylation domain-containing protein
MRNKKLQNGFSLSELLVVVAVMAMLIGIGVPATKAVLDSVNSSAGLRTMVTAAMSNARAIAIQKGKYAGIRFQTAPDGNQYMVFIVNDETATGLANGFRAVMGQRPIKLPGYGRVMDLKLRDDTINPGTPDATDPTPQDIDNDLRIDDPIEIYDTTTFCVIFSPAGKLVTHQVRIRNRHGQTNDDSIDKIFNTITNVDDNDLGLLYQDDYPDVASGVGLGQEFSRNNFIIYDKKMLDAVEVDVDTNKPLRWTDYLSSLKRVYLNPYTGQLVGGL